MSPISQDEIKQIAEEVHKSSPPKKNTPTETRISDKTWLSLPLALSLAAGVFIAAGVAYAAREADNTANKALEKVEETAKEHAEFRMKDAINDEQHKQIMKSLEEIKTFIEKQAKK